MKRNVPLAPRSEYMRRGRCPTRSRRINPVGKKGRANARANRERKPLYEKAEITRCEVRGPRCTPDNYLTWAHGRKRRNLKPGELEDFTVLACQNCHWDVLEKGGELKMTPLVQAIIDARETPVKAFGIN